MIKCVFNLLAFNTYLNLFFQENYSDPDVFDGYRYARMREGEGEGTKHGTVTPTNEYLPFGLGRHSWYVSD